MRFHGKSTLRLLALTLIVVTVLGCFAGCCINIPNIGGEGDSSNNSNNAETPSINNSINYPAATLPQDTPNLPSNSTILTKHSWDGLDYYLSENYSTSQSESYVSHAYNNISVIVVGGKAPTGASSSKEFAKLYMKDLSDNGYTCQLYHNGDISYTYTIWGDGTVEARGFYVYNGYGWVIYATTTLSNYMDNEDELVNYVTNGVIDPYYVHEEEDNTDNGGNNNTDPTDPTPSNPSTSDPHPNQTDVYTLVPTSWATPGCWAWERVGSTDYNAFDQWPGQTMQWNGEFYTTTAPSSINYVIINGAEGSLQTEDIAIDAGRDVWVIIDAKGEYYTLFYTEPTVADLAGMGY